MDTELIGWKIVFVGFLIGAQGFVVTLETMMKKIDIRDKQVLSVCLVILHRVLMVGAGFISAVLFMSCFTQVSSFSDGMAVAIGIFFTGISVVFGEVLPKRLVSSRNARIAAFFSKPAYCLLCRLTPAVPILAASNLTAAKKFEDALLKEPVIKEEIRTLIAQKTENGAFEKEEQDMVHRVLKLGDLKAGGLMTPRTHMTWLDLEATNEANLETIARSRHSRFPVARGSMDDFVGIIYIRDIMAEGLGANTLNFGQLVRAPLFVPKSMSVFRVVESFKQSGTHEAIVLDEYGGVAGIITLHDIMEEIVGAIDRASDPSITQTVDGRWLVDGMIAVDDFQQFFKLKELPEVNRDGYYTLGGLIISFLGYIPPVGESFTWQTLYLEVINMDRARVDKVMVSKMPDEELSM